MAKCPKRILPQYRMDLSDQIRMGAPFPRKISRLPFSGKFPADQPSWLGPSCPNDPIIALAKNKPREKP